MIMITVPTTVAAIIAAEMIQEVNIWYYYMLSSVLRTFSASVY